MKHRDVDLVIRNEKHMQMLIQYLVHNMKTLDGQRGSAVKILEELRKQKVTEYKRQHNRTEISKSREQQYIQINEADIFRKVCLKYTILKIRHKISYMAFMQKKTIPELFIKQIQATHTFLKKSNAIDFDYKQEE